MPMDRESSIRCWELALEMHRSMSEKEMTEAIGDDLHARVQKLLDDLDEVSDTAGIQVHRLDQMTGDLEDETDGPIEKLLRGLSSLEDKEEAKGAGIDLTDQTIVDAKRLLSLNIADPEIKQMQASALQAIHAMGDQSVDNRDFEEGKERCLGAYRWKAPEVLRGEPSTFASDVFSFAMCIIEVVSGQVPWGPTIPDSSVKFKVVRGCLPRWPAWLFNEEWKMIRLMCACDPVHRVDMASVMKALRDFSDGELDVGSSCASIQL